MVLSPHHAHDLDYDILHVQFLESLRSSSNTSAREMTSPHSQPSPSRSLSVYPFATSPDIIRSNQKDAYEVSNLSTSLTDLLRRIYGSRFTHTYTSEIHTLTHLLYFSLTTLVGNRTLGEEYTDLYQIEFNKKRQSLQRLPVFRKRAGYILLSLVFPYALSKTLPSLRRWVKYVLSQGLGSGNQAETKDQSALRRFQLYLLTHASNVISPDPAHAVTLMIFYFSGSYYHLSKRLLRLRYVFSKRLSNREEDARVGYEVLGFLLVLQVMVQGCIHLRNTYENSAANLDTHSEVESLDAVTQSGKMGILNRIAVATHTSLPTTQAEDVDIVRYDLADARAMAWIQPQPQRKCTLCLEQMKDPSVASCGHLFCWTCILDWIREKAECPLCRQGILRQHILPLRA